MVGITFMVFIAFMGDTAKSDDATTFVTPWMKNARGTQQEQVSFTKKTNLGNRSSDTLTAAYFWWRGIWLSDADENNADENETTRNSNKLPALGKLTSVFKPGRGKSLGSTMHIDLG